MLPIDNDCLTVCKEEEEEVQLDEVIGSVLASSEKVFGDAELNQSTGKAKGHLR